MVTAEVVRADVVIIGSGPGGGTLFSAVAASGADVLLVERGGFIAREPENWDVRAVFESARYRAHDYWLDSDGRRFRPGIHYHVGGSSKMWGACLTRFRAEDFGELRHPQGVSPAWPFAYDTLAPYYTKAELLYGVHGSLGDDPTAPAQEPLPFPPIAHEPVMAQMFDSFRAQGLHPYGLPLGIDHHEGGSCVRCRTCDGFPCRVGAKNDADIQCVRPAMKAPNARVATETRVERLITNRDGDQPAAKASRGPERIRIEADRFVVSAWCCATPPPCCFGPAMRHTRPGWRTRPITWAATTCSTSTARSWRSTHSCRTELVQSRRQSGSTTSTCRAVIDHMRSATSKPLAGFRPAC